MKKVFAILLIMMIVAMNFTMAFGWDDLNDWDDGAKATDEIVAASAKISGMGLAVDYVMDNFFRMVVTLVVTYIAIKLIFAKSGQSADASKQKVAFVVISVLIYTLGVPILNMLGSSFYTLF